MLVNLMPPPPLDFQPTVTSVLRSPAIIVTQSPSPSGFVVIHPRYRNWLTRCGLTTASALMNLPGEIVSGHPNRHVLQVKIQSGSCTRSLYLKKEHRITWRVRLRNWAEGFGRVSRSEREARTLEQLESAGLPGPHWVAYGEDGHGRAFVLIDELTGCRELRELLADVAVTPVDRRRLARQLGQTLAELHAAGFDTPELAAKHLFVRSGSFLPTVLDWQSSRPGRTPDTLSRLRSLAELNATVVEWLATPRERFAVARAYLQQWKQQAGEAVPRFCEFARTIEQMSKKLLLRSSIRLQRQPNAHTTNQRLVWVDGETVCAIPEIAKIWPQPAAGTPWYRELGETVEPGERIGLRLADDRPATLVRYRTSDLLGRCRAILRGKSWRSPAAKMARLLFYLQNAGVDVPQLYAFGQKLQPRLTVDSFLVHSLPDGTQTLLGWLSKLDDNPTERDRLLEHCGGTLRTVHDSGCLLGPIPETVCVVPTRGRSRLVIDPTLGGSLVKAVSPTQRLHELAGILRSFATDDLRRVLQGYFHDETDTLPTFEQTLLRLVGRA